MADFALVTCSRHHVEKTCKQAFVKRLFTRISKAIDANKLTPDMKTVEIGENTVCHIIKLPFDLNGLARLSKGRLKKISRHILEKCMEHHIENCLLPKQVCSFPHFEACVENPYSGKCLYKSLLIAILEEICSKRGTKLYDTDIAILGGQNTKTLSSVARLLSTRVKFITVITDGEYSVQDEFEKICEETGLSSRITNNFENGIRDAGIIINLGNAEKLNISSRFESRAIVINYGDKSIEKILDKNILINGIETALPENLLSKVGKSIYEFFSPLEISEIFICHDLNIENEVASGIIEDRTMEMLSEKFIKDGYRINCFIGRHGKLRLEELKGFA